MDVLARRVLNHSDTARFRRAYYTWKSNTETLRTIDLGLDLKQVETSLIQKENEVENLLEANHNLKIKLSDKNAKLILQ